MRELCFKYYVYTSKYKTKHANSYEYIRLYLYINIYIYVHIHIYMYIFIYTYTYILQLWYFASRSDIPLNSLSPYLKFDIIMDISQDFIH